MKILERALAMVPLAKEAADTAASQDPVIKAVHVFSSGWAEQHREHRYGTWKPQLLWLLTSHSWVTLPINFFLIEHRDGPVLFDTGLDPAIVTDPSYINSTLGRLLLRRIFRLHLNKYDRLDYILTLNGFSPADIETVVISHLHFDHVGGIAQIPQAKLLVSAREWAQLAKPHPERDWILSEHIKIPGADWQTFEFTSTQDPLFEGFEGVHDVMGDGSMILLPTPGHTPGSVSMLIQRDGWQPILLVGDAAYEAAMILTDKVPGTGNAIQLHATYANIRGLAKRLPGLLVVPSHDIAAAHNLRRAVKAKSSTPIEI